VETTETEGSATRQQSGTVVPPAWSRDKITHEISDVATSSGSKVTKAGQTTIVEGTREGVNIRVIIKNGRIMTGFPTNLPRNPL
jgi:hypothetical protein